MFVRRTYFSATGGGAGASTASRFTLITDLEDKWNGVYLIKANFKKILEDAQELVDISFTVAAGNKKGF